VVIEMAHTAKTKRYNLVLPEELHNELQLLADRRHTSVVELIRRFLKLGLLVAKAEESPDTAFLIREGDKEQQLVFL
jgi:hypothetical protein